MKEKEENKKEEKRKEKKKIKKTSCVYFHVFVWFCLFVCLCIYLLKEYSLKEELFFELVNSVENPSAFSNMLGTFQSILSYKLFGLEWIFIMFFMKSFSEWTELNCK